MPQSALQPKQPGITLDQATSKTSAWLIPGLIILACLALYFVRLGNFGVVEGGESYYPAAVREMLEANDMLVPRLNYQLYFSKPILTFWLLGSAYYMFGVNEFAGRFWSAVLSMVLVLCAYATTKLAVNKRAATLAAIVLATSPLLIGTCRRSSVDVFFSFFIGTAVFSTIAVLFCKRTKWWPAIYASLALAVLTKGPAGLVLFGMGTVLYLAVRRPNVELAKEWFAQLSIVRGSLLFLALVVPWFAAIGIATKGLFLRVFFIYENLGRFAGHTNTKHSYWWWYLVTLLYGLFPWCLYLPAAGANLWKSLRNKPDGETPESTNSNNSITRETLLFAGCSALATLVFFSLSKTQFETYVLPAWAPLAIVLGIAIDRLIATAESDRKIAKSLTIPSVIMLVAGVALGIGSIVAGAIYRDLTGGTRFAVPVAGLTLALGWTYQWFQLRRGAVSKSLLAVMISTCVAYSIATPVAFELWYQKMFAGPQEIAKSLVDSDGQVAQYNDFMLSLLYYRKGPVDFFYHAEHIVPRAQCDPHDCRGVRSPLFVIVKKDKVHDIIDRPNVHFTFKKQSGDWCLYESTDAVLRRSPTLQEMLENQSVQDMLSDKLHAGPLTMPYGGGSLPARLQ